MRNERGARMAQWWEHSPSTSVAQVRVQGPVVRKPISVNPRLNFNPSFFFFLSKALPRKIFSILFRVSYHQILGIEIKLNLLSKFWCPNSNFALNLDYLHPRASNNPALALTSYLGSLLCSERFFQIPNSNLTRNYYCEEPPSGSATSKSLFILLSIIVGFHMTSLKFKIKNYRSYRDFTFTMH